MSQYPDIEKERYSLSCCSVSKKYIKVSPFEKISVQALDQISFDVRQGEIFGIIGPDGAGKTTLFRILTSLLLPDSGTITIEGRDVVKDYKSIRSMIGYMPGKFSLYQDLSVEENLHVFASVFNTSIQENYHLVEDIYKQLEPFKQRRAGQLSGGMKQKLALCCAMIHKPKVLFLDEPTTGVDPVSRQELWEMLKRLKKEQITMLVSTSYMDEAAMCDRIALMQNGRFLKVDTPPDLIKQFGHQLYSVKSNRMSKLLTDLRQHEWVRTCFAFGDSHHVTLYDGSLPTEVLNAYLKDKGHAEIELKKVQAGIEDCFMDLTLDDSTVESEQAGKT